MTTATHPEPDSARGYKEPLIETHAPRRRGVRRLIVGELRSCSLGDQCRALFSTLATALVAGVTHNARPYPGVRILSLTAVEHDAYPPGSGLCTLLCVVRWWGPPEVSWVATDFDAARSAGLSKIAEGSIPDKVMDFFGDLPVLDVDPDLDYWRTSTPTPRPSLVALRPTLCACVAVAADGSVSRRCPKPLDACESCFRIWRTAVCIVSPLPAAACVPIASLERIIGRAVASAADQAMATAVASCPPVGRHGMGQHSAPKGQQQHSTKVPRTLPLREVSPSSCHRSTPGNTHQQEERQPLLALPAAITAPALRAVTHAVHPRCGHASCHATLRICTGRIVRMECTAGCRVPFHRTCWSAMALLPDETRACVTPDCWGLWARVTSTKRSIGGSEAHTHIEWSRQNWPLLINASVGSARGVDRESTPARRRRRRAGPPPAQAPTETPSRKNLPTDDKGAVAVDDRKAGIKRDSDVKDRDLDDKDGCGTANERSADDRPYVGRIRRRQLQQQQRGPPHKRIDIIKTIVRSPPSAKTAAESSILDDRAAAEQEATRTKRQQEHILVRAATLAAQVPIVGKRSLRKPRQGRPFVRRTEAAVPATKEVAEPDDTLHQHIEGLWASLFEWDRAPALYPPRKPTEPVDSDPLGATAQPHPEDQSSGSPLDGPMTLPLWSPCLW